MPPTAARLSAQPAIVKISRVNAFIAARTERSYYSSSRPDSAPPRCAAPPPRRRCAFAFAADARCQSMKINRSHWSGNHSRTRLKKCRRLVASARKEETGPPTGAENCKRGILSLPNAKPAPILSVRTHALPSVPLLIQGTYTVSRPTGIDDTIRVLVVLDPDTSESRTSCLSTHPMHEAEIYRWGASTFRR